MAVYAALKWLWLAAFSMLLALLPLARSSCMSSRCSVTIDRQRRRQHVTCM